jgi:SAM-dependent methyltransferase
MLKFLRKIALIFYYIRPKLFGIGYNQYKTFIIKKIIENKFLKLKSYIDERVVEIPWVIESLKGKKGKLLDVGCSLNHDYIINHLNNFNKIHFLNLYREKNNFSNKAITYRIENICYNSYSSNYFDAITCISTLEHIGYDNSMYNLNNYNFDKRKTNFFLAIKEIKRILKPGGYFFFSLPFGKSMNFKNLHQFNYNEILNLKKYFLPKKFIFKIFKYKNFSWKEVSKNNCSDIKPIFNNDTVISANSVILVEFIK